MLLSKHLIKQPGKRFRPVRQLPVDLHILHSIRHSPLCRLVYAFPALLNRP